MTTAEKDLLGYKQEVVLSEMTYEELQERYQMLKRLDQNLSEDSRVRYDYQYSLLCNHIQKCYDEIQRRNAAASRKSDPQTGNYTFGISEP